MFELLYYFYKLYIYNICGVRLKKKIERRNKQSKGLENIY